MCSHFSWKYVDKDYLKHFCQLDEHQAKIQSGQYINLQKSIIPSCRVESWNLEKKDFQEEIYNSFHHMGGCIILKNVFDSDVMEEYNQWCEEWLKVNQHDPNGTHPKQKDKFLINDIIGRLSKDKPELFMKLFNNNSLIKVLDILLGFTRYGSATCHWIQPGGDRQLSHVDYPIHIGSGKYSSKYLKQL